MSKLIPAVLDRKGNVIEVEHILHENGVREVDGVFYGEGKPQLREAARVVSNTSGESLTKQSFSAECDIQNIVKRAFNGQPIPRVTDTAQFLDLTQIPDYQTSLNRVIMVEGAFAALDANMRASFGNDPANLVHFLSDPANAKEAVKMGLLDPSVLPAEPIEAPKGGVDAPKGAQGSGDV